MTEYSAVNNSLRFIGTATVLLRYGALTILTDPNFLHAGDHAHIGYGLTAKRLTDPACELAELPLLDFVLLSHYHGDHFDQVVERELDKRTPILTTPHAAKKLQRHGFSQARGLRRWEGVSVEKEGTSVTIRAMPATHGPGPVGLVLPPVMGSLLDFRANGERLRLYISGDTLIHEDLREIPRRFPEIDLALLHLGGTRVLGIMVTMDGKQGVRALKIIAPRVAIPIHFDDYDRFKSPLSDFERAVAAAGLASRVTYVARGETMALRGVSSP